MSTQKLTVTLDSRATGSGGMTITSQPELRDEEVAVQGREPQTRADAQDAQIETSTDRVLSSIQQYGTVGILVTVGIILALALREFQK
jgi:hypothetical protein